MSIYCWAGAVIEEQESLMLIKASDTALRPLQEEFTRMHAYEVPEFVVLEVSDAESSAKYLAWVNSCSPTQIETAKS